MQKGRGCSQSPRPALRSQSPSARWSLAPVPSGHRRGSGSPCCPRPVLARSERATRPARSTPPAAAALHPPADPTSRPRAPQPPGAGQRRAINARPRAERGPLGHRPRRALPHPSGRPPPRPSARLGPAPPRDPAPPRPAPSRGPASPPPSPPPRPVTSGPRAERRVGAGRRWRLPPPCAGCHGSATFPFET